MLANYSELQTEIADTLHRDDLTSKIPTFIQLFEIRANRNLRTLLQEVVLNTTLPADSSSIVLPADFIEFISLSCGEDTYKDNIPQLAGIQFDQAVQYSGQPNYLNISGSTIYFDYKADKTYNIILRYIKKWDLAADTTNWLLTNHPDAYLYGSLAASAAYIGEDDRLPLWIELASKAVNEANDIAQRTRSKTNLRMDSSLTFPGRYNVNSGDYK